jgi:DNA-binding transcriptional MerR regulator
MKTISQVAELTGISCRTLQYYDEIGLLHPSELTQSGYRLYDDEALQKLQQILFFKELGFKLKDINEILQRPDFDRIQAFKKQKDLLLLKRNRIDRLIQLLSRLEKGEQCMSFKEFDLSDYINALEDFKSNSTDEVIKHWGSVENFDMFIQKIKDDEAEVAKLAIQQFGSIEKYTEAMKYNLEHFSEIMERQLTEEFKKVGQQSDLLYAKLTADLSKDIASSEIQ